MPLVVVKRPPRRTPPPMPSGEVMLDPPPELPDATGKGWGRMLSALPMAAGAAAMGLMMSQGRGGPITYVAGGMYGFSTLGMMATMVTGQSGGPTKKDMIASRRQYMRRLSALRAQMRNTITQQREAVYYRHPDPETLWSTASSGRLWERRRADADFCVVRVGLGPQEIATKLVPPQTKPVDELEPLCATALRAFVATYSIVPDLPVAVALTDFSHVYVNGPDEPVRRLITAMLAELATFHAPDDLLLAFCVEDNRRAEWEWAKWLPHALHPTKLDAVGAVRLFAPTVTGLEAMLDDVLANRPRFNATSTSRVGPHLVVLIDGGSATGSDHLMTEGGVEGVTLVDLSNPAPRLLDETNVILDLAADNSLTGTTMDGATKLGRADVLDAAQAEVLVRELAPLRLSAMSYADQPDIAATDLGLGQLLGIEDPYNFDLARIWASRPTRDRLRVPIGVGLDGRPIELDLKESAQDGMGPHGLLVGATGSGKSELLRTLVLALATTHSSEILNFVLVDFKGGATFTKLDRLPHTSAVITNLADELSLVDRMLGAIQGELVRRQELLRKTGNYASQRDYERARASGVPLVPLPSLLIICDEFSELLTARPDFIEMFVQIGRIGRSIGVHLLLASQRLEEGRLRGLDSHLSFRLGLRTFSSMESRAVLGAPDAYELPRSPGHGYLKTGTEGLIRFKAAYVSGVHELGGGVRRVGAATVDPVRPYTTYYIAPPQPDEPEEKPAEEVEDAGGDTLLDILVARLQGQGPPAHQVWLPPLAEPPTLDQLLPSLVRTTARGLTTGDTKLHGALHGLVGIIDKPFEQRRDPMWLDFSGAQGNLILVGGPQSGKSTVLRTLVCSMAMMHTPQEVQVYALDFGGGALSTLGSMPHVGGTATRRDVGRVRRTVAELYGLLEEREARFTADGVDGIATYRRAKREGRFDSDPFGDVFLVVDGWSTLRNEFEDLEGMVNELASRGLGYGLHILASANRWMEVRPAQRDMFGTRIELRLGEPADSAINRRAAVNVPEQMPGRGLTPDGLHFLAALPRIDGRQSIEDVADGVAHLVAACGSDWSGPVAPAVRLLPDEVPASAMPAPLPGGKLPIGIAESDLEPVFLDFADDPHVLLFGDVECGKSSFLRGLARSIVQGFEPAQARVIMVDQRRSLLGCIDTEHLIGYGSSSAVTADLVAQVATVLRERLPGPDVQPEQLRTRSWWKGAELFMLIDDYDLVAGGMNNPLSPLLEFIPQARDLGLHLVITRRMGGASRALFEPFIARIRELATPGILMSGNRDEGPLFGNMRPQPLPPGRGWLITRRHGARLIQLPWHPPAE